MHKKMKKDLLPDLKRDLFEVDQFGFINLGEVYEKGVISGDFNITDEKYNRIPPDCVLHRPSDMFEALRQKSYVQDTLRAAAASAAASAAAAE